MKGSLLKKGLAALAAFAVGVGGLALGASSANAAEVTLPTDTTVTLTATNEDQFLGHTFKAVKVADYAVVSGAASLTTVDAAMVRAGLAYAGITDVPTDASVDPLQWAVEKNKLDQSGTGSWLGNGSTRKLADYLAGHLTLTAVDDSKVTKDPAEPNNNLVRKVDLGGTGLWLIVDQAPGTNNASTKALPILVGTPWTTAQGLTEDLSNGTVEMKNQLPTVEKTVDDPTPSKGKDVVYTLTSKVPNYVGYRVKDYTYRLKDTFNGDAPAKINYTGIKSVTIGTTELKATDYTVTYYSDKDATVALADNDATKAQSFRIDFSDYIQRQFTGTVVDDSVFYTGDLVGQAVTVEYGAHVNAALGQNGVKNSPVVEYSNKPGEENSSTTPGTNPGPEQKVFNFPVTLIKTDKTSGDKLNGAEFEVLDVNNKVVASGKTDGTGSDKKPEGKVTFDGLGATTVTDQDGNKTFSYTYTVKETKAPAGHVLPADATFKFTISGKIIGTGAQATVTDLKYAIVQGDGLQSFATMDSANATITLKNAKNITELPLTGAAGTTLFTVIGLLLAGAAVTVYTKSRKTRRDLAA